MKQHKFGDYVYYKGNGYLYLGMDEDGAIWLCRPQSSMCFNIIEFEHIYVSDETNYDTFAKENGESHREYCERKGIDVPK